MEFTEAFRKVINTIDPVANSKIAPDNTPVKILADWSRHACDKLSKLTTDRNALLAACKEAQKELELWKAASECDCPPEGHICGLPRLNRSIEQITAAIAQANKE